MKLTEHGAGLDVALVWTLDEDTGGRAWPCGAVGPTSLSFSINGQSMHVWAFRVELDDGILSAVDPDFDRELDALMTLLGDRPETCTLPELEGQWVIVAVPYGD